MARLLLCSNWNMFENVGIIFYASPDRSSVPKFNDDQTVILVKLRGFVLPVPTIPASIIATARPVVSMARPRIIIAILPPTMVVLHFDPSTVNTLPPFKVLLDAACVSGGFYEAVTVMSFASRLPLNREDLFILPFFLLLQTAFSGQGIKPQKRSWEWTNVYALVE